MNDDLMNKVWIRDNGICQKCSRELIEVIDPTHHYLSKLSEMKNIPIYKWEVECWKCHKKTPLVSYSFELGFDFSIGSVKKLDDILVHEYKFVKFNPKLKSTANFCIHCGGIYGNTYVYQDLVDMLVNEVDMKANVDSTVSNTLTIEDLFPESHLKPYERRSPNGVVHHIDGNPEKTELNNLVLLCRSCHGKLRIGTGHYQKKREKGRIKRESKQAEKWRRNYYARKKEIYKETQPSQTTLD